MLAVAAAYSIDLPESHPATDVQSMGMGSINEDRPTPSVEPSADTELESLGEQTAQSMFAYLSSLPISTCVISKNNVAAIVHAFNNLL